MTGSYNMLTTALEQSEIKKKGQAWVKIPQRLNTLFRQASYYWSVLTQYNQLKQLSRHNFNSAPPDFEDWASAEIWGYGICDALYQYYCHTSGYISEEAFHASFWEKLTERQKIGTDLRIPQDLQEAALSLAKLQATIDREKGHFLTRSQLREKSRIHKELRSVIRDNLQPELKTYEEAVDAVISGYTTKKIVHFLEQNTDEAAMSLSLFLGLKLIPSLSDGRIEDDRRRTNRLFEPACTCSLRTAQAGIENILIGYAYADISNRTDMILYWKNWLNQWGTTEKRIALQVAEVDMRHYSLS